MNAKQARIKTNEALAEKANLKNTFFVECCEAIEKNILNGFADVDYPKDLIDYDLISECFYTLQHCEFIVEVKSRDEIKKYHVSEIEMGTSGYMTTVSYFHITW